jgi:hypothetical protein
LFMLCVFVSSSVKHVLIIRVIWLELFVPFPSTLVYLRFSGGVRISRLFSFCVDYLWQCELKRTKGQTMIYKAWIKPILKKINVRENQRGNQEWTIQRHWQHWAHKTQKEGKQSTKNRKLKRSSNTDPTKNRGVTSGQCLWIVHSWLPLWFSLTFIYIGSVFMYVFKG